MLVNNVLAGEDNYSIIVEGDTNIYIRNSDDKLNTKRRILGLTGELFDIYDLDEGDKIVARLKEINPSKVVVIYSTLSGLAILYRYLDTSIGLKNIDIYLESLDFFDSKIDINCVDFEHYSSLDSSCKRMAACKTRRAFYNRIEDIMNEHEEISFDYRNFPDRGIKAVSHFIGSFMKMMFNEVEYTKALLIPSDIITWGGRQEYQGKLKLFNMPAVKIDDKYIYPYDKSIKEDRDTILLKLDRPHWFNLLHKINLEAEELLDKQYPDSLSRFETLNHIMDIMHPDDIDKHLKVVIIYEISQKLTERMFNEHLTFGISRLACADMQTAEDKSVILLFEYIEADRNYYKSEAEIYQALEKIMDSI